MGLSQYSWTAAANSEHEGREQMTNAKSKEELLGITRRLLEAVHSGDLETYSRLCAPDLTCYETDVAPYRIDGVDFHLDLMRTMKEQNAFESLVRFDMLSPEVQVYGDCAIVTYTRLMTYAPASAAPFWRAFNESRVYARFEGEWKMVHFHRSHAAV
jgi:ketosteroid isomerase-like protein